MDAACGLVRGILIIYIIVSVAQSSVPGDFNMRLETIAPWPEGQTDVYIGDTVPLRLTISFPKLTQASKGTIVEILTSLDPTIFAIGKFDVTNNCKVGENINIEHTTWIDDSTTHPGFDQVLDNTIMYKTRAVIDLGDVSNASPSDVTSASQLVLDYEIVHVAMGGYEDGHEENTSAGMEYNDESRIYVVQLPLKIHNIKDDEKQNATLKLESTTFTDVEVMKPVTVGVRLTLPHPSNNVTIMVPAQPDTMYAQRIQLREVGDAFAYSVNPNATDAVARQSGCPLSNDLTLRLGPFVSRKLLHTYNGTPSQYNDVIVDVTLMVAKRGVANATGHVVVNNEEPMTFEANLQVVERPSTTDDVSYVFFLEPLASEVSYGFPGLAILNLTTPSRSRREYTLTFKISSELHFVAANPVHLGANMPCEINPRTIQTFKTTDDYGFDEHRLVFTVLNTGDVDIDQQANTMLVEVVVMMMSKSTKGTPHNLLAYINGGPQVSVTFTEGDTDEYSNPVSFDTTVVTKCSADRFQSGTVVTFLVTVVTERGATPGAMTLEAPIPYNLTNSTLAFLGASVVSKGRNVVCVQLGPLDAVTSKWNAESDFEDRAVMTLPLVCNRESVVDKRAEDEFVIEIKVRIKDTVEILTSQDDVTVEFGIGIEYSSSQVWVATHFLRVTPPTDLLIPDVMHVQRVTALGVNGSSTSDGKLANDAVLQWSADNEKYYDVSFDWTSDHALPRPVIARYVRVINKNGNCMDPPLLDRTTVDVPEMYGSVGQSGPLLQKLMLTLDDDDDTCLQLPTKDETSTTPYLWMDSKTSVFGISGRTNFTVRLSGRGLVPCAERGPQFTYVTFPKERSARAFEGNKIICPPASPDATPAPPSGDRFVCEYSCHCVGEEQCERFSLMMLHTDVAGNYSLCSLNLLE